MTFRSIRVQISLALLWFMVMLLSPVLGYAANDMLIDKQQPIDFSEAILEALYQNPEMEYSVGQIKAAEGAVIEARAIGLPKLNLEVNASNSNNPLYVFGYKLEQRSATFADFGFSEFNGPGSVNTKPRALNHPGYRPNYNTAVAVSIPIFAGGKNFALTEKAQALAKAACQGNEVARADLIFEVLQVYEGVHIANRLVKATQESLEAAKKVVQTAEYLKKQGIVIESDILLAKSHHLTAEVNYQEALTQKNNFIEHFRIMIGKPESTFIPGRFVEIELPMTSITELKLLAFHNNPKLSKLRSHQEAGYADIKIAKSAELPKVNIKLRQDWNAKRFQLSSPSNLVVLEAKWEILSFGAHHGAKMRAAAEYTQSKALFDKAADDVQLAVVKAYNDVKVKELQMKASRLNVEYAKEAARLINLRYKEGISTITQLLDTQAKLDTACAEQVLSQYNSMLAKARLLQLIGVLEPENCNNKGCVK